MLRFVLPAMNVYSATFHLRPKHVLALISLRFYRKETEMSSSGSLRRMDLI